MSVFGSRSAILVVALLSWLITVIPARAGTIEYVATNLVDVTPGEDLWRYDYTVGGRAFLQSEFFDIYFAPNLYSSLTAGPAPNADWDVLILQQPNPVNLPPFDTGIFDAFALTDGPSLSGSFSVSFIYLGQGSPGAQAFEIFDAGTVPALLEAGLTTVPGAEIPEPSTAALFLIGLAAWAIHLHRRHGIHR